MSMCFSALKAMCHNNKTRLIRKYLHRAMMTYMKSEKQASYLSDRKKVYHAVGNYYLKYSSGECLTPLVLTPQVAERAPWRSSQSCVTRGQQPIGDPYRFLSFLLHTWQPLCDPNTHSWGRLFQLPGG